MKSLWSMDHKAFSSNYGVKYRTGGVYPVDTTLGAADFVEADIIVRAIQVGDAGSGSFSSPLSFKAWFMSIFDKYKTPNIHSDDLIKLWSTSPMDWWQSQLNFAVWCATTGCWVSVEDHLMVTDRMIRSLYRFHVYFQVRRILAEMSVPLPQDRAWDPTKNPYDRRAYERICNDFDISPNADWHVKGPNHGLGKVYFFAGGRYMPAYGAIDPDNYDPSHMSFDKKTKGSGPHMMVHVDFIKQDSEGAGEAWRQFILDKSQGLMRVGAARIDESIRTYVWAILGSQGQAKAGILGADGAAIDAQNAFMADVESAISAPVSIQDDVDRYQKTPEYARSEINYSFGTVPYMAPADMLLQVGHMAGYNNNILISTSGQSLGLNLGINTSDTPLDAANDPDPPPHGNTRDPGPPHPQLRPQHLASHPHLKKQPPTSTTMKRQLLSSVVSHLA